MLVRKWNYTDEVECGCVNILSRIYRDYEYLILGVFLSNRASYKVRPARVAHCL